MNGLTLVTGALSVAGTSASLWGALRAYKVFGSRPPFAIRQPPVSIIKPIKGADPGSRECLESFFRLNYFRFELLFAVADPGDPIVAIIEELIAKYPQVPARILFGLQEWGPNPKVNTMASAYQQAAFEWLWISDAQVIVAPDSLQKLFSGVDNSVGLVSGVVCGLQPKNLFGRLECTFLNTFYAKWSLISDSIGTPCVMGKSMLFRKQTLDRMGGIRALGKFLAEDFMAGQGIQYLGLKVKMQQDAIFQWVGAISWKTFWARHLRWGRIRKAQAPLAYYVEPILTTPVLASAMTYIFHQYVRMEITPSVILSLGVLFSFDFLICLFLSKGKFRIDPFHWLIRELIQIPLWIHIGSSQKINWRGSEMAIRHGGLIES